MNQSDIYHRQYEVWLYDLLEPDLERLFVGRPPSPTREIKGWQMRNYNPEFTDTEKEKAINEYMKRQEGTEEQLRKEEREDDFLRKHGIK